MCKDVFRDDIFDVQDFTLVFTFPMYTTTSGINSNRLFDFLLKYAPCPSIYHCLSLVLCYGNYQAYGWERLCFLVFTFTCSKEQIPS